jgi:hypothetical protein
MRLSFALTTVAVVVAGVPCSHASPRVFTDPAPYCASIGAIDRPDARYAGPALPDWLAGALKTASGAAPDAPLDIFRQARWRCADGKVLACLYGANIPCDTKADRRRKPSTGAAAFCRDNPEAEQVPAFATGRATVYAWRCNGGKPVIVKQIQPVDRRGYAAAFWYEVEAPP